MDQPRIVYCTDPVVISTVAMTLQDENVVAYIGRLRTPGEKSYAQRQWRYLQGKGSQPDHRPFGVSDTAAQQIRIHLAGMK